MTLSDAGNLRTWDGRPLHHNDCTYCLHRKSFKPPKKKAGVYEIERCSLTGADIPHPHGALRWCEKYAQIGCTCSNCVQVEKQTFLTIDNPEAIC